MAEIIGYNTLVQADEDLEKEIKEALAQNKYPKDLKFLRFLKRANELDYKRIHHHMDLLILQMNIFIKRGQYTTHKQGIDIKMRKQKWETYSDELKNG